MSLGFSPVGFFILILALHGVVNLKDTRGLRKIVGWKMTSTGFGVLSPPIPLNYCVSQGRFIPSWVLVSLGVKCF